MFATLMPEPHVQTEAVVFVDLGALWSLTIQTLQNKLQALCHSFHLL